MMIWFFTQKNRKCFLNFFIFHTKFKTKTWIFGLFKPKILNVFTNIKQKFKFLKKVGYSCENLIGTPGDICNNILEIFWKKWVLKSFCLYQQGDNQQKKLSACWLCFSLLSVCMLQYIKKKVKRCYYLCFS